MQQAVAAIFLWKRRDLNTLRYRRDVLPSIYDD